MNPQVTLNDFGHTLLSIRDLFHKTGHLSDSNEKLDEIIKLLSIEIGRVYYPGCGIPSLKSLLDRSLSQRGFPLIQELNSCLKKASRLPIFYANENESIFGETPSFSLSPANKEIAEHLIKLVSNSVVTSLDAGNKERNFEFLNEAFGHFVRDNFRNNIEDAQYMTPPEVVQYMVQVAIKNIKAQAHTEPIVMLDPSCGVGSFLAQFNKLFRTEQSLSRTKLCLVGQDKVERMARLAKLNALLFNSKMANVWQGNSLIGKSMLTQYINKCDVILTNPPFGARFHTTELRGMSATDYPLLHDLIQSTDTYIDSELLFLDRYVSLLKPGGNALVVLPDSVVSSNGIQEIVRERLLKHCRIRSIIELPAVTFAQAGTRTRTCILHFEKTRSVIASGAVFVASAKQLGFEVSSKKGVPIKKSQGINDLTEIFVSYNRYVKMKAGKLPLILSETPSCVAIPVANLVGQWTPNFHAASRYSVLNKLNSCDDAEIENKNLSDLVYFPNKSRMKWGPSTETKCISVLHIGNNGYLNVQELMQYNPKYPGQQCQPGDILFSKINPRIPRALVVPELNFPLACSSEFEVMRPKDLVSAYAVMALLLSPFVQIQIQALTSGTSSSHNRIKTAQLKDVLLPIPKKGTRKWLRFSKIVEKFKQSSVLLNKSAFEIYSTSNGLCELLAQD
ncbi:MAG: N-6 DNA methylase [Elusimicrobia bacterium]|nr:N-6 DNA methylase [Elusimicrobiota bacterium]